MKTGRIFGLKRHILIMEQLLPLSYVMFTKQCDCSGKRTMFIFMTIMCQNFKQFDLDKLESRMIQTLCHLEMLFPPTNVYNHGSFNMSPG